MDDMVEIRLEDYIKNQEEMEMMKLTLKEIKTILYGVELPNQKYNRILFFFCIFYFDVW